MALPTPAVVADRSVGVVLASAAGDALGAPHEFHPALRRDAPLEMTGGGSFAWRPGEWTDDTQMALALLTPLAAGDRSLDAVERGFLDWYRAHPADVGNQTASVLGAGLPLGESAARYQKRHPEGAGNGGLMRIGPAGLSHSGEPARIAEYAAATTALTHPHRDCVDASILWSVAIDHTIHLAPPAGEEWDFAEAVRLGLPLLPAERRDRWDHLIDEAVARPAVEFSNNGWVIHAFQAALAAIVHASPPAGAPACRHLPAAIEAAVRCGNDTDTVAAIAGALLGARWGATAVPLRWSSVLRGQRINRQPDLAAHDLERLARLAAGKGAADRLGWPSCQRLVPYYLSHFDQVPISVELGGAHFGNIAGLAPAIAAGANVVVSLCRMGTEDVPAGVGHPVVGLIDTSLEDNPNLPFLLADTADFIAHQVADGRSVYVHCVQAEHRTPAVAAAYLARHRGMSVDKAIETVKAAIPHHLLPWLVDGLQRAADLDATNC
jgi:ADP-ribosylglycohydrolase